MRHGAARFAKNILQETCALPIQIRSAWKSVVDPRAVAEGWGFGPGALDLTAHGVRDTPAVRFSEIARASSRRAHAPARPAPRPGPAYCSALPSADGGCAFGWRSKAPLPDDTPLPGRDSVLRNSMHPTRCTSSARRPPPPRLSFHEGLAMGQYEGSGLHSDDRISCKAQKPSLLISLD